VVGSQAENELGNDPGGILRITGLVPCCVALVCWMLANWGLRGVLEFRKPWRLVLFCAAIAGSSFGGFRNVTAMLGLLLVCQFFCEGLLLTRFLPISAGFGFALDWR